MTVAIFRRLVIATAICFAALGVRADPEPALDAIRRYYSAVTRLDYAGAIALRATSNFSPIIPFALGEDCVVNVDALTTNNVRAAEVTFRAEIKLPVTCGERASSSAAQFLDRDISLILEDDAWRVEAESSVYRSMGNDLLAAADRTARLSSWDPATRDNVALALIAEADEWMPLGDLDRAQTAIALIDGNAASFDELTRARNHVLRGKLERYRGEFTKAAVTLSAALARCENLGDSEYKALALNEIANVRLRQLRLAEAEEAMRESLRLHTALDDQVGVANVLSGLGIILSRQGRYREAVEQYNRSEAIRRTVGDDAGLARVLNNYGLLLDSQNESRLALAHLREATAIYERMGNRARSAGTTLNVARVLRSQGSNRFALHLAQRAYDDFCDSGDKFNLAVALRELAANHIALGEWPAAMPLLDESITLSESSGFQENVAPALTQIGEAMLAAGDPARALPFLEEALGGTAPDAASATLVQIAHAHSTAGNHAAAIDAGMRAMSAARALGKAADVMRASTIVANSRLALGQQVEAENAYRDAIAAVETMRAAAAGGELPKAEFLAQNLAAYHGLIRMLADQGRAADALEIAERAKGRALVDVLRGARQQGGASQVREAKLRQALVEANAKLAQATRAKAPAEEIAGLQGAVAQARLAWRELQIFTESATPVAIEIDAAAAAATILNDESTALLEYVTTADQVYLFAAMRKDGAVNVKVYPLGPSDLIVSAVNDFFNALSSKNLAFNFPARQLFETLLAPVAADLESRTKLVIVPDGELWAIPFEALRDGRGRFLVERAAIAYAPSAAAYVEMGRARAKHPRHEKPTVLALADPDGDLQDAVAEVRSVAKLYGGKAMDATETRFKNDAAKYDIVHLATHGFADAGDPMYSRVILKPGSSSEDGLLEAWEIAALTLNADLVVLSACETAAGRQLAGEGTIGMSWAWFLAGTPAAVLGRWLVDSAATAKLMIGFHEHRLRDRVSDAEALRRASLDLMKDPRYKHPYYWAAFQMIGAGG